MCCREARKSRILRDFDNESNDFPRQVNGTGRIISSDVVSGKRTSADKKTSRTSEPGHHHRKVLENEEYERFARSESIKGSSTPNRQDRRKSKELEKRIRDPSRDDDRTEANTRTKNYSTVSLPNYDELDVSRHPAKGIKDERGAGEKMKSKRPVRSSTGSLPAESFLSPFSEVQYHNSFVVFYRPDTEIRKSTRKIRARNARYTPRKNVVQISLLIISKFWTTFRNAKRQ